MGGDSRASTDFDLRIGFGPRQEEISVSRRTLAAAAAAPVDDATESRLRADRELLPSAVELIILF